MTADSQARDVARVYRLVLCALDESEASREALELVLAEIEDAGPHSRCLTLAELAHFCADRIRRSATPQRWERALTDRIAELLDHAAETAL